MYRFAYGFWGKVRTGQARGKQLGFPTANVNLHQKIPEGIYLSFCRISRVDYPSITFIGKAKTFEEKKYQSETYILNFNKNIYNQWVGIRLLKKIRGNKKFGSEKELVRQMKKDLNLAKEYFK